MKNRKLVSGIVIILITLIIIICVITSSAGTSKLDTSEGESYLAALDAQNVQKVEQIIRGEEATDVPAISEETTADSQSEPAVQPETQTDSPVQPEQPTQAGGNYVTSNQQCYVPYYVDTAAASVAADGIDSGSITLKELFANSLFVGDSIITGFSDFNLVNKGNVIAEIGSRLDSHLADNAQTIINYNPEILVLHYGINEIEVADHWLDEFIAVYTKDLQTLQTALPNTKIIVVGLTPVTSDAVARQERFGRVAAYNERIRQMCVSLGVGYNEDSSLFTANFDKYAPDGIHFSSSLYVTWMSKFVREMGLS